MTYLFDAQIMRFYFDLYKIPFEKYKIINKPNYEMVKHDGKLDDVSWLKPLFDICRKGKINKIGDDEFNLSKTWYDERAKPEDFVQLKKNMENFFRHYCNTPVALNLWTTFKEYKEKLTARRYPNFLACNAKSTNDYMDKTAIAYLINKFIHRSVEDFFKTHGIKLKKPQKEQYALAEMLQFIFRSAIREGKAIKLYIPSKRMRRVLLQYLQIP